MITIQPGDLSAQHPSDTVLYDAAMVLDALGQLKVERVRPAGDGRELRVTPCGPTGTALQVSGGIDGARYRIRCGDGWFDVRVTSHGLCDGHGHVIPSAAVGRGIVAIKRGSEYRRMPND